VEARLYIDRDDLRRVIKLKLREWGWPSPDHDEIADDIIEELGYPLTTPTPAPPAGKTD